MSWQLPKAECLIFHLRLHFSKLNLCIVLTAEKFCIWHVCKPAIHLHLYLSEELLLHFLRRVTLWADWPLNSSRSVLGPFLIHRGSRAHSSLCVYFHWPCWVVCLIHCSSSSLDPSVADTQGFYFYSSSLSLGNTNLLCVCYHGTSKYSLIQGPTLAQMLTGQKYMITPTGVIYFFLLFILVQNQAKNNNSIKIKIAFCLDFITLLRSCSSSTDQFNLEMM